LSPLSGIGQWVSGDGRTFKTAGRGFVAAWLVASVSTLVLIGTFPVLDGAILESGPSLSEEKLSWQGISMRSIILSVHRASKMLSDIRIAQHTPLVPFIIA